jgi:hypothetical protein
MAFSYSNSDWECGSPHPKLLEVATPATVVAAPIIVKESGSVPIHLPGIVMEFVGTEMDDQGCSCKGNINCGKVMEGEVVVHLRMVQIMVEGQEETVIACVWVTDWIDCCHVGFIPCHMAKYTTHYNRALA